MTVERTRNIAVRRKKEEAFRQILRCREKYTPREWGILHLYYVCGLTHKEIAGVFQVARSSVSRSMGAIRRKALTR